MKLKSLNLLFLFLVGSLVRAEGPVLDLGNIEIEGEVRRPPVKSFQSSKVFASGIKKVVQHELSKIQEEIFSKDATSKLEILQDNDLQTLFFLEQKLLNERGQP